MSIDPSSACDGLSEVTVADIAEVIADEVVAIQPIGAHKSVSILPKPLFSFKAAQFDKLGSDAK